MGSAARREGAGREGARARAHRALLLAAAGALLAAAPVRAPAEACTLPGDEWREYRSAHFVIDMPEGKRDPAKVVALFEELHAAVVAALVAEPVEIPGRVRVIALPSASALAEIAGAREIEGLYWVSDLGEPTILLTVGVLDDLPQVVAHELAHHVSFHLFPRQPRWFAEGIAQFLEGVARPDRQGRRWAGGEPAAGWAADGVYLAKTERLLTGGGGAFLEDPYLTSWVLYRYLWNEHGKRFSEYQRRLSEGESPGAAWKAVFPEWDPSAGKLHLLDHELERHRRRGRGLRWEVTLPPVDRAFTAAPASTADLHMALLGAKLFSTHPAMASSVRRAAAREALREDAAHAVALAALAQVDGTPALPALRASVAARPADGRGWYLLAQALEDPAERVEALRRAVELWPDGALAHAALAAELARAGQAREAVRAVNRGLELAPWNPRVIAVLGRVALELGKCREAMVLAARAAEVAAAGDRRGAAAADADAIRRQLEDTRTRCAGSEGAAPGR